MTILSELLLICGAVVVIFQEKLQGFRRAGVFVVLVVTKTAEPIP